MIVVAPLHPKMNSLPKRPSLRQLLKNKNRNNKNLKGRKENNLKSTHLTQGLWLEPTGILKLSKEDSSLRKSRRKNSSSMQLRTLLPPDKKKTQKRKRKRKRKIRLNKAIKNRELRSQNPNLSKKKRKQIMKRKSFQRSRKRKNKNRISKLH